MTLFTHQRRESNAALFPFPGEGVTVFETPPCLSWLPEPGEGEYEVTVRDGSGEVWRGRSEKNYIVPGLVLAPGKYVWDVVRGDAHRGESS